MQAPFHACLCLTWPRHRAAASAAAVHHVLPINPQAAPSICSDLIQIARSTVLDRPASLDLLLLHTPRASQALQPCRRVSILGDHGTANPIGRPHDADTPNSSDGTLLLMTPHAFRAYRKALPPGPGVWVPARRVNMCRQRSVGSGAGEAPGMGNRSAHLFRRPSASAGVRDHGDDTDSPPRAETHSLRNRLDAIMTRQASTLTKNPSASRSNVRRDVWESKKVLGQR